MRELLLVRHGRTEWNAADRIRGRVEVPLDETGQRQAAALAGFLADLALDAIYVSPLTRARQTAGVIARPHGIEVQVRDGLIDLDYGRWQGLTTREAAARDPERYARWLASPHRVRLPGGESLAAVRRRAMAVIEEAAVKHQGTVVVVSHRAVNTVLTCALLGLGNAFVRHVRQGPGTVCVFTREEGGWVLTGHNLTPCGRYQRPGE